MFEDTNYIMAELALIFIPPAPFISTSSVTSL